MGGVGRRVLFSLRNALFQKLQELPLSFFNRNKTGDLMSRLTNDTDKVNQCVSQAAMQFVGGIAQIVASILTLNVRLGIVALIPAALAIIITRATSDWIRGKKPKKSTEPGRNQR